MKNRINFFIREKTKFSRKNYDARSNSNQAESAWIFEILDKYFPVEYKENLKIADIGSKNWSYVKGEYDYFKKYCKNFSLKGIEVDAHRLYNNFYSRLEVAKFNIKNMSECEYIARNFLDINEKYNYIVWILPFIFKHPHIKWGLPLKFFDPEKLLSHAYNSLFENGKMLIINQGKEEFYAQKQLLNKLKIKFEPLGEIKKGPYEQKRFGIVVCR